MRKNNCKVITLLTAIVILSSSNNGLATGSSLSSNEKSGIDARVSLSKRNGLFPSERSSESKPSKIQQVEMESRSETIKQKLRTIPLRKKIRINTEHFLRKLFSHPDVDEALKEIHNEKLQNQKQDRKKKRRRVKRTVENVDSKPIINSERGNECDSDDIQNSMNRGQSSTTANGSVIGTLEKTKTAEEPMKKRIKDDNLVYEQSFIQEELKGVKSKDLNASKKECNNIIDEKDEMNLDREPSLTTSSDSMLRFTHQSPFVANLIRSIRNYSTSQRIVRLSLTCVQFYISYYLAKSIWTAICEVIDEIQQQEAEMGNQSGGVREDHDLPFLSEEAVDSFTAAHSDFCDKISDPDLSSDSNSVKGTDSHDDLSKKNEKKPLGSMDVNNNAETEKFSRKGKRVSQKTTAITSNLALRLHASGLPLSSPPDSSHSDAMKTVPSILKSLTRTEGQLLSNTLLSPIDTKENGILLGGADRLARVQEMWNQIGGLEDVKQSLWDLVFPLLLLRQQKNGKNERVFDKNYYGGLLSNPSGVLLYGPPGCGKTMLVRALAHTANARFLCVTPSTLFRKYVGETNLNIRALFTVAKKISPCIIFIDEMEGLFRERGGSSTGGDEHEVSRELKTEFMQLWDGIQTVGDENTNDQILIVGATNRPFDVDSAFLRRMPRSFFVGLPNFTARVNILNSMLLQVPKDDGLNIPELARITDGYSPSDLKEVLRTAALFPLREARSAAMIERQQRIKNGESEPLTFESMPPLRSLRMDDVLEAKDKVAPTLYTPTYKAALEDYAKRASGGRLDIFGTNKFHGQARSQNSLTQSGFSDSAGNHVYNVHPLGDNRFYTDAGTVMGDLGPYHNYENSQSDFLDDTSEDYDEDEDLSSSSYDSSF